MSTIYILRHGQTSLNKEWRLQGRSDVPLDERGRLQAWEAAGWFAGQGIRFDAVYSSPLLRAVQTAEPAAAGIPVRQDERLLEMDYGPYEGADLREPAPELLDFFRDFSRTPAGMEPLDALVARLGGFLEELRTAETAGNILISTHAVAMKAALEYLTPESRGSYWGKHIGNCGVYAVTLRDGVFGIPEERRATP